MDLICMFLANVIYEKTRESQRQNNQLFRYYTYMTKFMAFIQAMIFHNCCASPLELGSQFDITESMQSHSKPNDFSWSNNFS